MNHTAIWRALDSLAAQRGLTPSALAKLAGLDPTTFNKSKRTGVDGKPRWPSSESLARVLEATGLTLHDFAVAANERGGHGAFSLPIVGLARAGADGFFDDRGFPTTPEDTVQFPELGEERAYALEISGDSMEPVYRDGDVVIVQPGAQVRRGDRIVVRTSGGEVMAKQLGRKTETSIELLSLNPAYPARTVRADEVEWIARILWASQ